MNKKNDDQKLNIFQKIWFFNFSIFQFFCNAI
jgi:hypothetical protein